MRYVQEVARRDQRPKVSYYLALLVALIALIALLLVTLKALGLGLRGLAYEIEEHPTQLALAVSLLLTGEILKSYRLVVAARVRGYRLGWPKALKAHLFGLFVGVLTPAYSGAAPTVASFVGNELTIPPSEALSIALSETLMDSMIPAALGLAISLMALPRALLPLILSILVIAAWAAALTLGPRAAEGEGSVRGFLRDQYVRLTSSMRAIVRSQEARYLLALTLTAYLIETLSVIALIGSEKILLAFEALMLSYVGGNVPTPGGEMGVEYSMASLLGRHYVILWRLSYLIVALIPAPALNAMVSSYMDYGRFVYDYYRSLVRQLKA